MEDQKHLICIRLTAIDIDTISPFYTKYDGKVCNTGLGNILFEIASMYVYAMTNGYELTVPGLKVYAEKEGIDLKDSIFKHINTTTINFHHTYDFPTYCIHQYPVKLDPNIRYSGHFECYDNFISYKEKIYELFNPSNDIIEMLKIKYKFLNNSNISSIHSRIGLNSTENNIYKFDKHSEYYKKAINIMLQKGINTFVLFSDQIDQFETYIKEYVKTLDSYKIELYTVKERDYIELWIMSMCSNNIICQSTFSWWGAFLNSNKNKIVICPNTDVLNRCHYYLDDWIHMDF